MNYSAEEIMQYIEEEDIKFIRLAFCDVYDRQKNVSVMPGEIRRAFDTGIAIDASSVDGFGGEVRSDLFLRPDPSTLTPLPWRPEHGGVVRMFCDILYPDGTPFECDTRALLRRSVAVAKQCGISFSFGSEMEFYLFRLDENGDPTKIPYDRAGYMDIAPADRGENVRREICLTLDRMGISPETSHHEEGPGQNEIDFHHSDPLKAADDSVTFRSVVETIAARNGLFADFSPKPIDGQPGNGFHINVSAVNESGAPIIDEIIRGIIRYIPDMTVFLNSTEDSYKRLGSNKAPRFVTWSSENRSQLIRRPAADDEHMRAELRSPDPLANPYLAFTLIIHAVLDGIKESLSDVPPTDVNLFVADDTVLSGLRELPRTLSDAGVIARTSDFICEHLPSQLIESYCN